jgi:hypothetical protein
MSVLLFSYTQAASTIFEDLPCVDVSPSSRVVLTRPTIGCRSDEYRADMVPAILALVVYIIGFPLAVLIVLFIHKETLFMSAAVGSSSRDLMKSTARSGFFIPWSPLFQMFHPRAWFWQPLILLRRMMFVLAFVLLVQEPATRSMAFACLNLVSLLGHLLARPFDSEMLNRMESSSYVVLVISILLTRYLPPYTTAVQGLLLLLFVVLPVSVFVIFIVTQQWREYLLQQRNKTPVPASASDAVTETRGRSSSPSVSRVSSSSRHLHPMSKSRSVRRRSPVHPVARAPAVSQHQPREGRSCHPISQLATTPYSSRGDLPQLNSSRRCPRNPMRPPPPMSRQSHRLPRARGTHSSLLHPHRPRHLR